MLNTVQEFHFGTKASNLLQLRCQLKSAKVLDILVIYAQEWNEDKFSCLQQVKSKFPVQTVIIRSSAPSEDSSSNSMAGAYTSVLNINTADDCAIIDGIEQVIESYKACPDFQKTKGHNYEILIQPMLSQVICSGVLFTRTLESLAPYYVINYDDTSTRTDSITSGNYIDDKKAYIYRENNDGELNPLFRTLITTAKELEKITKCDYLDIEFAFNNEQELYILQVRPIVCKKVLHLQKIDQQIKINIAHAVEQVEHFFQPHPQLFGQTTMFGQMPDWNPAEIIGPFPKPLASSIYQYIIMNNVWREGRKRLGYYDPRPHSLMIMIFGRPFVDIRASFNSLIPNSLPADISEKLINYYINKLKKYPEYHDKVEFEVVFSCYDFNETKLTSELRQANFSTREIQIIRENLRALTEKIIYEYKDNYELSLNQIKEMASRRSLWLGKGEDIHQLPKIIKSLLDDCITLGTIHFSTMARCAFIGTSFLKSLASMGVLTPQRVDEFLFSIQTVAGDFKNDLIGLQKGQLKLNDFLVKYGHLRPGTYDISSYRYDEKPELYFSEQSLKLADSVPDKSFTLTSSEREAIENRIEASGIHINVDSLLNFIRTSIEQREYIKFEFTKNLSSAMKLMVKYGEYFGFNRNDLSYLHIEDFISHANYLTGRLNAEYLRNCIDRRKVEHDFYSRIYVPDLITSAMDLTVIAIRSSIPNFITSSKVVAPIIRMDENKNKSEPESLKNKIVLLEHADPGYDWVFSYQIAGMITKYGGAASHMAIRCAEFGIPSAIGCGEKYYKQLMQVHTVELNCKEKKIIPYGVSL